MLHILNGDSLAEKFPNDIHGKKAICREALVEGPVAAQSTEELWVIRDQFFSSHYPEVAKGSYFEKSVPEFESMMTAATGTKIYCWFELDLFCQVNLWFVMHLIEKHQGDIYLVLPEKADLRLGFAELNERELEEHYRNPKLLTKNEREILSNLWTMFQKNHIDEASTLAHQAAPELPFLPTAVQAWKDSIPHGDYPGKPKATLLQIIQELGSDDFPKVFREFKNRVPIYGYGDMQVKHLLDDIKKRAV